MVKKIILLAMISLFLSPVSYALENIDVIPNSSGIVSKSKFINFVIKISNEYTIGIEDVSILWNGQDVTKEIRDNAVLNTNTDGTEIIFYYPMPASLLTPGTYTINTYADADQHEYTLSVKDIDTNHIEISCIEAFALDDRSNLTMASSTTTPSVTGFSGSKWTYGCSNPDWKGYYQVAYEGFSVIPLTVKGKGLDKVTSVDIIGVDYRAKADILKGSSSTQLILGIQANKNGWSNSSPKPISKPKLRFYGKNLYFEKNIDTGVIPAFYVNNQAYGQCTWYAGMIMRLRNNQKTVSSYGGTTLSGNPSSSGFPKKGSVLNCSNSHMAYLEGVSSSSKSNSDGSTTFTYTLTGSQFNADCKSSGPTSFSTKNNDNQMIVKKSKDGKTYSITKAPKVVYTVTKVTQ